MKRMSYETYTYLKYLLDREQKKVEEEYRIALDFIPSEPYNSRKQSGQDKAYEIFRKKWRRVLDMMEELHDAAAACTHKDHPNPEMRKFWGLEE